MQKIKIITGYSGPGGSTEAHSKLCNLFNKNGLECVMYGPHDYHTTKCKGDLIKNMSLDGDDILIVHFTKHFTSRPPVKKVILSLHEKDLFPLQNIRHQVFDKIQYNRESQRLWHGVDHPYFYCSNVHDDLKPNQKLKEKIAGIVGHIDPNKNVHISIERALNDGFKKIKLYGRIHDNTYFNHMIRPLIYAHPNIIGLPVFEQNKQKLYDSVTDVYLSSKSEVAPYIQGECLLTGTKFHGTKEIENDEYILMSEDEIFNIWKRELEL